MNRWDQFKDEVKERADIAEIVNAYLPLKRAGAEFRGLCPFHAEKTPSFYVIPAKQSFYCFGCQKGGDVFRFVMEHEHVDFVTALKILAHKVGVEVPEPESPRGGRREARGAGESKDELYQLHDRLAKWYQQNLRSLGGAHALQYVKERGLSDELVAKFGLGYAPNSWDATLEWGQRHHYTANLLVTAGILVRKEDAQPGAQPYDRFRDRLTFPIQDEQGRTIAFSARVLSPNAQGAKYINSPETPIFQKNKVLYGLFHAREGIRTQDAVVVCEGQMDVIACHQAGIMNAVAPMGTAFTENHARLIRRYTENVTLLFDGDAAGLNAATRSAAVLLPVGITPQVALLPPSQDPDSVVRAQGAAALQAIVANPVDYFEFRLDQELAGQKSMTVATKARIVEHLLADVARLQSFVKQSEYCRLVADRLKMDERAIGQELQRLASRGARRAPEKTPAESPDTAPAEMAAPNDIQAKTEAVLLALALHHGTYANRMLEELPKKYISATPAGRALNEVLAHTEQGEWNEARDILRDQLGEYDSKLVNQALLGREYDENADKNTLKKAYEDCHRKLLTIGKQKELRALDEQIKVASPEDRRDIESHRKALRQEIRVLHDRPAAV